MKIQDPTSTTTTIVLGPGPNCTEDMECWNCETMGNHLCGPQPTIGTAVVIERPVQELPHTGVNEGWAGAGLFLMVLGAVIMRRSVALLRQLG